MTDTCVSSYAELHCLSHYTFLRGASSPEELVNEAVAQGYRALALTDECSLAGVVRAHMAIRNYQGSATATDTNSKGGQSCPLQLIIGSEFRLQDGMRLVLLAANLSGYAALCGLITRARRAASKGSYELTRADLDSSLDGCLALYLPHFGNEADSVQTVAAAARDVCRPGNEADELARDITNIRALQALFPGRLWLAAELFRDGKSKEKIEQYQYLIKETSCSIVACGDVHMHRRSRRALQDTVTAIRLGTPVAEVGLALQANGERYLRAVDELQNLYPAEWLDETVRIAGRCDFSLADIQYQYPCELVPEGLSATAWLRRLTEQGLRWRWPEGAPAKVHAQVEHELKLIAELAYEPYFLTVHDIVRFARERGILCQGRGSAANSAVCYCLGITEVDPARMNMLFERFISKERNEPPDIDVDFEHERREEVIQYIYNKYGRERAALTATVITYRPRSAIRDVGKALGLSDVQVNRMARSMNWWDGHEVNFERVREAGLDPDSPLIRRLLILVKDLLGSPRHLSQHVGGFLISERPLTEFVPIENASMKDRTIIQWDKNDLDDLGLLKVDVLALGMLTAIHRSFDLLQSWYGQTLTMATVPAEDPRVYDMISAADTVGVFQIESRAQMSMLPRLQPRCFYDLVIEVALIRPGPIQGGMVHPYLRRRKGEEPVSYPSEAVKTVLERTLGVPIFQEQVMQLAIVAAGFSAGEADQLRRAMAAWKRRGGLEPFEQRLYEGMRERGYAAEFAEQVFKQIRGFGEYGFPESHSASFALLVYVSAWLKCHEPAVFFCALLNSQPMGFYAPSQLVQIAQRQGVAVRPVDINYSTAECTLEQGEFKKPALRLGLNRVHGLSAAAAEQIVAARLAARPLKAGQVFKNITDLAARVQLNQKDYGALAAADALNSIAGNRHKARWAVAGVEKPTPLFPTQHFAEGEPLLSQPTQMRSIIDDYASVGLTLNEHPLAAIRAGVASDYVRAKELWDLPDGASVHTFGLVITRQRPGSAKNVTFVTLEDETGFINLVVWETLAAQQRQVLIGASILGVYGKVQKQDGVLHVIASQIEDCSSLLQELSVDSRDWQ